MKKGIMIAFDGVNGAGKTGSIKAIKEILEKKGFDVLVTREPGGTSIGERIRGILLDPGSSVMSDITEVMLFAAGRNQHISEVIVPAINEGKIVLCDRFSASTYSFQEYARGMDKNMVKTINEIALDGFKPNKNIIFDLDPMVGMQRVTGRGEALERFEMYESEFHNRVRQGLHAQVKENPQDFIVIDATPTQDQVVKSALNAVLGVIRENKVRPKSPDSSPSPCE